MNGKKNKIIFLGSPQMAVDVLDVLKEGSLMPDLIITQPDKKKGRKMLLTPPPVQIWADENNIPTLQPEKLDSSLVDVLGKEDWDLFILVAYGKIIPKEFLNLPRKGILNLHPSLLPLYRGATPIHSVILNGEKESGVSIILLDEEMDHGLLLNQERVSLWKNDVNEIPSQSELEKKLALVGANLLLKTIDPYLKDEILLQEQIHSEATYCQKLSSQDALIDLGGDPLKNFLKIRAFDRWPKAHYFENQKRVLIKEAIFENGELKITKILKEGERESKVYKVKNFC